MDDSKNMAKLFSLQHISPIQAVELLECESELALVVTSIGRSTNWSNRGDLADEIKLAIWALEKCIYGQLKICVKSKD